MDSDAIVIGSGFGGAITACRISESGQKILILERGREWDKDSYPRKLEDEWIWSHSSPEKFHGWLDFRTFAGMSVAQGAGGGGGSLIYANISRVAPDIAFKTGWPPEITLDRLQPYFATVGTMLDAQEIPQNQRNPRMKLTQEAATKIGDAKRFNPLPLAVTFDLTCGITSTNCRVKPIQNHSQKIDLELNRAPVPTSGNVTLAAESTQKIPWTRTTYRAR